MNSAAGEKPESIRYSTRDEKGNDIIRDVQIKQYPSEDVQFICKTCGQACSRGIAVKRIVSANFTDWAFVGDHVCEACAKLFSLYFYSYEVSPNGIELFNAREASRKILGQHVPPFRLVITRSRKKHLFYKSVLNHSDEVFCVNLEDEPILTSRKRMRELFGFVECLITIGQSKMQMERGELSIMTICKVGFPALDKLRCELARSREIQIPLFCGQPRDISEEEAIRCITTLTRTT